MKSHVKGIGGELKPANPAPSNSETLVGMLTFLYSGCNVWACKHNFSFIGKGKMKYNILFCACNFIKPELTLVRWFQVKI